MRKPRKYLRLYLVFFLIGGTSTIAAIFFAPKAKQIAIKTLLFRYRDISESKLIQNLNLTSEQTSKANNVRSHVSKILLSRRHLLAKNPYISLPGQADWLHYGHCLHSCLADPSLFEQSIPPILDFARKCAKVDIDLYVIPVPPKWQVHPESTGARPSDSVYPHRDFVLTRLRAEGVKTIDLAPIFAKAREANPELLLYYKADTHWTPEAARIAAEAIAKKLGKPTAPLSKRKNRLPDPNIHEITIVNSLVKSTQSLPNHRSYPPTSTYPARIFSEHNRALASPILLIGDSFSFPELCAIPQKGSAAPPISGLPAQLGYELGQEIDWIVGAGGATRSSLTTFARRAFDNPNYLEKIKTILWIFEDRSFIYGTPGFTTIDFSVKSTYSRKQKTASHLSEKLVFKSRSDTTGIEGSVYLDAFEVMVFQEPRASNSSSQQSLLVFRRAKTNGKVLPAAKFKPGEHYQLELEPWETAVNNNPSFARAQVYDDSNIFDAPCFLLRSLKPITSP